MVPVCSVSVLSFPSLLARVKWVSSGRTFCLTQPEVSVQVLLAVKRASPEIWLHGQRPCSHRVEAYPTRMADQETRLLTARCLAFVVIFSRCYGFNLDPRFSVTKRGSRDSYFGYSVTEHQIVRDDGSVVENL